MSYSTSSLKRYDVGVYKVSTGEETERLRVTELQVQRAVLEMKEGDQLVITRTEDFDLGEI